MTNKQSILETSESEAGIMPAPFRWVLPILPGLAWWGLIGFRIARCWALIAIAAPRLVWTVAKAHWTFRRALGPARAKELATHLRCMCWVNEADIFDQVDLMKLAAAVVRSEPELPVASIGLRLNKNLQLWDRQRRLRRRHNQLLQRSWMIYRR